MDNFALLQRIEHVKEIMDNVMDLLPERLPHDLSRITSCKSEMENLREIYHDRIISDPRVHMQQKYSGGIEELNLMFQHIDIQLKFERERSAHFPPPGQTMEVISESALLSTQDNPKIVGQRTAAGINIWRTKTVVDHQKRFSRFRTSVFAASAGRTGRTCTTSTAANAGGFATAERAARGRTGRITGPCALRARFEL